MPTLRRGTKPTEIRFSAPDTLVYALSDVSKGGRYVRKGEPISRDDPMVRELPSEFEVRYRLSEEVRSDG
jgi:hypothetical protein